jgi:hypothetical protein
MTLPANVGRRSMSNRQRIDDLVTVGLLLILGRIMPDMFRTLTVAGFAGNAKLDDMCIPKPILRIESLAWMR